MSDQLDRSLEILFGMIFVILLAYGLPERFLKVIMSAPRNLFCDRFSGREHSRAAEGATDSETLRQKDRFDE